MTFSVFELRQYTLHHGERDTLIELFDREFVGSQEAGGMWVIGQFRDLDRPDRFVWFRAFRDMADRARALTGFYGGPVWKQHGRAAAATMIDSDDVLLLRPAFPGSAFPALAGQRRDTPHSGSVVIAAVYDLHQSAAPVLTGPQPLALLVTEPAENNYPALPVRADVNAFVAIYSFPDLADCERQLGHIPPPAQMLRLEPTARSLLR